MRHVLVAATLLFSSPAFAAHCTAGYYRNVSGHMVHRPECVGANVHLAHETAICRDGSHSLSEHHQGTLFAPWWCRTLGVTTMALVRIYRFEVYDASNDSMRLSRRWGTLKAINEIARGVPIMSMEAEVDESLIQTDIVGLTERDFNPNARPLGFQTRVTI